MTSTNPTPGRRPVPRRLVLGTAIAAAFVLAVALPAARHASDADHRLASVAIVGTAVAADAPAPPVPPKPPAPADALPAPNPAPGAGPGAPTASPDIAASKDAESTLKHGAEITIDEKGIRIEKPGTEGRRSRNITIRGTFEGDPDDPDFAFKRTPRWVGPLAFVAVSLFFLVPLAAVALVVWYKMRRTRMLNDTLLKYAEKGIAPPPEALHALGGSAAASAMEAMPAGAPMYEQAKAVRKRVAWSDLRKGVIMAATGLGLVLYSMINHDSANVIGLVLLFVGIGYVVLWFMEDRQARQAARDVPPGGA
jgi:hypothetical protein